jgi:molybdopterin-binding protein
VTKPTLLTPREAAQVLGVGYATLKQWIYRKKLKTVKTPGGHHRIPESELDPFLPKITEKGGSLSKRQSYRKISGRNQLVGRLTALKIEGLMAQVTISIGGQKIQAIITADAAREMRLKVGDVVAALIKSTEVMVIRPE